MRAMAYKKYGPLETLNLTELPRPVPGRGEVLVRIRASSVNYNTGMSILGTPLIGRLWTGLRAPKYPIPGNDISGVVEETGPDVKSLQPGDEVYADTAEQGFGAYAEYIVLPEEVLSAKPSGISHEEAAAVPEAGLVAYQALRDSGKIRKGMKVLIQGSTGGIGSFALQLARYFGAEVTAVCSGGKIDFVKALGADQVLDYTKEKPERDSYDLIIATAGYNPISLYRSALKKGGVYVCTGGDMKQIFQAMLLGPWLSLFSGKKLGSMIVKVNRDLDQLSKIIESGQVKPVIDRTYPLEEAVEALKYYGQGHSRGRVIIRMVQE